MAGGKIEKIYQPDGDELIIHIHATGKRHRLYISSNSGHARMHLLEVEKEQKNPQNPAAFCMLLRKHFQGARIKSIHQVESERIIELDVDSINELGFPVPKRLTVEIMGKHSNIIAIDLSSGKILDSIKRISSDLNRYRQILPGFTYIYPPDHNKVSFYSVTEEDLEEILLKQDSPLPQSLVKGIQGVSPVISEEICRRAIKSTAGNAGMLSGHDLYLVITDMKNSILSEQLKPVVYVDKDRNPVDFHIFALSDAESSLDKMFFDDPSGAVEYYFTHKISTNRIRQKSSDLMRALTTALDRLYLKKQKLSEELYAAENSESYRVNGELLTANLHNISKGAESARVTNYYDGTEVTISLDPRFSPSVNAQRYFKKYAKAKTAIKEKRNQLAETNNSIDYLESVSVYVDNADTVDEIDEIRQELAEGGYLRKRKNGYRASKSKLQPFAVTAGDGSRIFVGRNSKENDLLTMKLAGKGDYWFHTKDIPGSHVILSSGGSEASDDAVRMAASLAAYYSKARNSDNVPVDYTLVKYVKKPAGAKPGMVIYSNHKTLYVDPEKN